MAPGAIFTTLHFLSNLQMGTIGLNVCPMQGLTAQCNVTLCLTETIHVVSHIHNNSFSLQPINVRNTLVCYMILGWKSLPGTNFRAYRIESICNL